SGEESLQPRPTEELLNDVWMLFQLFSKHLGIPNIELDRWFSIAQSGRLDLHLTRQLHRNGTLRCAEDEPRSSLTPFAVEKIVNGLPEVRFPKGFHATTLIGNVVSVAIAAVDVDTRLSLAGRSKPL